MQQIADWLEKLGMSAYAAENGVAVAALRPPDSECAMSKRTRKSRWKWWRNSTSTSGSSLATRMIERRTAGNCPC